MRHVLLAVAFALSLGASAQPASSTQPASAPSPRPPNVVVLFADDLGYGDLASYGHPTIRTPHLDRLAREGVRLLSFYAAAPACTPSRAALLTGRHAVRVGLPIVLGPESANGLRPEELTLAEALKGAGYRTLAVGKWHLGSARPEWLPTAHGFDGYLGLLYSNDMIRPWVQTDAPLQLYRGAEPVEHPVDQSRLTTRYTEEAVRFIEAADARPFFVYLAYAMPHLPLAVAEERRGRSRAGLYGDVIEEIDWSAGRILAALEAKGVARDTLVFFSSDNGPWLDPGARMLQGGIEPWDVGSPGLLRGAKATTYEGGVRVPGILRWPARILAGQTLHEIATALDLFPTVLAAAGVPLPDRRLDGHDLLPWLSGTAPRSPTSVFHYFHGASLEAIRDGRWKLRIAPSTWTDRRVELPKGETMLELFDLEADPAERYDQADANPDVVQRLRERMRAFESELKADQAR